MSKDEWYVILNMNCKYEICRMCPKSGLFKGTYEECEKWIEQKKKEELKQEAEELKIVQISPREKLRFLGERCLQLMKDKGNLTDKVKELEAQIFCLKDNLNQEIELHQHAEEYIKSLEAQIEKMKCCETCRYYHYHEIGTGNKDCILWYRDKVFCENKNMWELGR